MPRFPFTDASALVHSSWTSTATRFWIWYLALTTPAVLRSSMDELREQFAKEMRGVPKSEWESSEYQAKWQQMYRQMKESAPTKRRWTNTTDWQRI